VGHYTKVALATFAATVLMAVAVTDDAGAQLFSFSNWSFRVVFTAIEFTNPSGFGTVRCPVTMEGSFHSQTISKVEAALIGHVSRATMAEASCTSGPATIKQETLPWHIGYNGFRGILPSIKSVRLALVGFAFVIREPFGSICQARGDPEHESRGEGIIETGEITNIVPDEAPNIPITNCVSSSGRF